MARSARTARSARVLIYSHDTFGLGHLRRCRAIAHSLVGRYRKLSVLILSGSPIIGSFDFRMRVDFVRIPGVIKLRNGEYQSLSLHMDVDETVKLRASLIEHAADAFDPDIFIVDKEPTGLRGEVEPALRLMKARGVRNVLGLRDVLDDTESLAAEWSRKKVLPALRDLYDEIWVYGLPQMCEPLAGLDLPPSVMAKVVYTGYLKRETLGEGPPTVDRPAITEKPFILVTTGGGGDGDGVIDWVLSAYETDRAMPYPALLVLGPFMPPERRAEFFERAAKLPDVAAITFDNRLEELEASAIGMVGMGGYNTFCEILSVDKPAIIVPRTRPRLEQFIRAKEAERLGLVQMLVDPVETGGGVRDPKVMARALRLLPGQARPSDQIVPGLLEGLENVNRLARPWIEKRRKTATVKPRAVGAGG